MRKPQHATWRHAVRFLFSTVLSLGLLLVLASTILAASTHAKVIESDPKAGSTISKAPTTITVKTAENMKPGATNSNLFVYGPSGDLISQGDAIVGLNDPTHMSVTIKPEKTGIYVVRWATVSADDGDPDEGAFSFTVGSATSSGTNNSATGGTPLWVSVVTGLVALLVGLGGGFALSRANRSALEPGAASTTISDQEKISPTRS